MRLISRRRLLVGGSAGAALAAAGGIGAFVIRDGEERNPAPSEPDPTATSATALPTPTPPRPHGGTARIHAPLGFNFDTFDAARSGEPTIVEVLGRTHSRLIDWVDPAAAVLGPALATSWEQADEGTLILHLDPRARWHDRALLNGTAVTAEQVRLSLERAVELARDGLMPGAQRPHDWLAIRRVSPGEGRITIETDSPNTFLAQTLASRFALIQAPEAVDAFEGSWQDLDPASVVGCGPFTYEGRREGALVFRAHRGGHRDPALDQIHVSEPHEVARRFRERMLDEAILRDRREAPLLRDELGEGFTEATRFEDSPVVTSVFAGAPPWDNPRLRQALSAALNRHELIRRLFAGRARPSGPVPPAHSAFALSEGELERYPGYRKDHTEDFADARALWEAAGGPSLGTMTVDFPAIFDPVYSASSVVSGMLEEALGVKVRVRVDSYTVIAGRMANREYGNGQLALWFGWGPPMVEPDPSRSLIEMWGPGSATAAVTGYALPADARTVLGALAAARDLNEQKETVKRIQAAILEEGGGGLLYWALQEAETLRWNYYHGAAPVPFWAQQLASDAFLEPGDPSYSLRPGP